MKSVANLDQAQAPVTFSPLSHPNLAPIVQQLTGQAGDVDDYEARTLREAMRIFIGASVLVARYHGHELDEVRLRQILRDDFGGSSSLPAKPTFTPPPTIATGRPGRPRNREFTAPFSSQLAQDVYEIIDAAVASEGLTRRAIVEMAIRQTWGSAVGDRDSD